MRRPRLLFVSEYITLAQVTRLVKLAEGLNQDRYEIHFAAAGFDSFIFRNLPFRKWPIVTVDAGKALRIVKKGGNIYRQEILEHYIKDEFRLINTVQPDVIIGDLRTSLCISAAVSRIPFINLINAYWSPYACRDGYPLPEHPINNLLGPKIASLFYPLARPFVFNSFAKPVNRLRKKYGLPEVGTLEAVLTCGDYVIYPDTPELIPMKNLPAHHFFIGPVIWSPEKQAEENVQIPSDRPLIYATMGSSGAVDKLPLLLEAFGKANARVMVSTAGRARVTHIPDNVIVRDFLPGSELSRRAALVITNGGSSTGYQALMEAAPVLGIPSNLDQHLCMQAIQRASAGEILRSDRITCKNVTQVLHTMLEDGKYRESAREQKNNFSRYDHAKLFESVLKKALGSTNDAKYKV